MIFYETTSSFSQAARPAKTVGTHTTVACVENQILSFSPHTLVQREHDVQESILFMAKQSGNVDPDVRLTINQ